MSHLSAGRNLLGLILFAVFAFSAADVRADQVFVANTTIGGTGVVNGQAIFHQSGANLLQITLSNLQATSNVGQAISGIQFQIFNSSGTLLNITGSISTQNNPMIEVDDDGVITNLGTMPSGWGLASSGPSFNLTALGFTGNGTNPPDELIVGTLAGPNGSIAGNTPHNPYVDHTGIFTMTLNQNLPTGFQISNVVILFGTGPSSVNGTATVPEPASMVLLGTGLIGIAAGLRRRAKRRT